MRTLGKGLAVVAVVGVAAVLRVEACSDEPEIDDDDDFINYIDLCISAVTGYLEGELNMPAGEDSGAFVDLYCVDWEDRHFVD